MYEVHVKIGAFWHRKHSLSTLEYAEQYLKRYTSDRKIVKRTTELIKIKQGDKL